MLARAPADDIEQVLFFQQSAVAKDGERNFNLVSGEEENEAFRNVAAGGELAREVGADRLFNIRGDAADDIRHDIFFRCREILLLVAQKMPDAVIEKLSLLAGIDFRQSRQFLDFTYTFLSGEGHAQRVRK